MQQSFSLAALCLACASSMLSACGGGSGGGDSTASATDAAITAVTAAPASIAAAAVSTDLARAASPAPLPAADGTGRDAGARYRAAIAMWRDNGEGRPQPLQVRPKGSCVGCHGPDMLDLARIGTDRATAIRRATTDGASLAEATLLADVLVDLRLRHGIVPQDPRSFRPFQPGGSLLPGATSQDRDIAFGLQLQRLLPTLMGPRIATLAQAQRARDELLDIARGGNLAGANPVRLNMRSLPVGIPFPQWSADAFNAGDIGQTTLNDWLSDLAFEPAAADRPQWLALQDAYLADPSNANFWRLFAFVDKLALMPAAHVASLTDAQRSYLRNYSGPKYRSALIGQHLLRTGLLGTTANFLGEGAVAFNYLLADNFGVNLSTKWSLLPQQQLWDVADVGGRGVMQASINTSAVRPVNEALAEMGFPGFVQQSAVAPDGRAYNRWQIGEQLRLSWFWIGLTLDPSMQRLGRSGATQGGEYINQTLANDTNKLFIHDQFSQAMKGVARTLPEAGFKQAFSRGYVPRASEFFMGYYLIQYHPGGNGLVRNDWVTPEQKAIYTAMVNNTHRMYLLLYAEVLARSRSGAGRIPQIDFDQNTARMRTVFNAYEPQHGAADETLIQQVKVLGGF